MAAALLRRGTGLCVRCIHRELCRLVWRPQTALFSSKASDKKQPRRTHITRPAKASPVPLSSFSAAPSGTPEVATAPHPVEAPTTNYAQTKTTNSGVDIISQTTKEIPTVETITEPPLETNSVLIETPTIPAETLETGAATVEGPVEPEIRITDDIAAETESTDSGIDVMSEAATVKPLFEPSVDETVPNHSTDSGLFTIPYNTKEEPLIETTEHSLEASNSPQEILENKADVAEGSVETVIKTVADTSDQAVHASAADPGPVNLLHTTEVSLIETVIEPEVETSSSSLETLEIGMDVADLPLEPSVDARGSPAQCVLSSSPDSSHVDLACTAAVETMVEPSVEAGTSLLETLESKTAVSEGSAEMTADTVEETAAQSVQNNSVDFGVDDGSFIAKDEPLIENTTELIAEARTSPDVSESKVESTVETESAENLSDTTSIQNMKESAPLTLESEVVFREESPSGLIAEEEGVNKPEQMTLESVTLHGVQIQVESLKTEELLQANSFLEEKAEQELQEMLVQTGSGAESKAVAETTSEDESENISQVLSKWDSLSEDLQKLEGESGALVKELLWHIPAAATKSSDLASDPLDSTSTKEKEAEAESMTLESVTLASVKAEVRDLETEILLEARNELEKEAEVLAKEGKMEVTTKGEDDEDSAFDSLTEAEILSFDSLAEVTDAIEAETSVILEAMFGSEQGPRQPADTQLVNPKLEQQVEPISQEEKKGPKEQEVGIIEAMTLESVTLAEVEASLGTLESEFLSETSNYLEKEAEVLAGEEKMEMETKDMKASEETTEALNFESLSLSEDEALQVDTLMEDLLFSVPGPMKDVTEGPTHQEAERENKSDAMVATGSVNIDTVTVMEDDFSASPSDLLEKEEIAEEVRAQTEALETVDGAGTHTDLDPVQRLFLEKIREYSNKHRLSGGPLEAESGYEKNLSEETAKLQRQFGGGDLNSFPEFTFTEPKMDQDS
ncbi:altered inheritance of mitochondria protein 21-like isoform X2 [Cheilinus undulatus]|uniref:altered inheritance of mitochondria protein 21-like isoform X2 n=1 Tax=Cheilinus undulatus TaxID=241271 RepID=UPI001BD6C92F|nr:altered inheritance of mitochondria protein 21-like isoform X2 [Cheilinus undulatus]